MGIPNFQWNPYGYLYIYIYIFFICGLSFSGPQKIVVFLVVDAETTKHKVPSKMTDPHLFEAELPWLRLV